MTDHQRTMTDHQRTMTDHQRTMTDHQRTMTDHQRTMTDHQRTMNEAVLITGAERGLGLCLVKSFLARGARVVASKRSADRNLRALGECDGRLVIMTMDIADPGSVRAARESLAGRLDAIDWLVNNAAVYPKDLKGLPFEARDLSDGALERTMQVNAFGALHVTQQFLPLLEKGRGKTILNVSSEAGSIGDAWRKGEFEYCLSKAALNMQTRLLSNALGPRGYRVISVHPGWMRTEMGGAEADIAPEEAARGIVDIIADPAGAANGAFVDYRGRPMAW